MTQLDVVSTNKEIDDALIGSTAKSAVLIRTKPSDPKGVLLPMTSGRWEPYRAQIRPIAAFLRYIEKKSVPAGHHTSFEFSKKVGVSRSFTTKVEVASKIGGSIKGVDLSLEVTTGFEASETFSEETTQKWTTTVDGPADWWIYQPILVYAICLEFKSQLENIDLPHKWQRNGQTYCLIPLFRNSPTEIAHDIEEWNDERMYNYLFGEGFDQWQMP